jgi:hypothetical protein
MFLLVLLLLQVPSQPPSAEPLYLKVAVFEYGGYMARSLQMARASYEPARQALQQQQMALLTGKVRPVKSYSMIGRWQANGCSCCCGFGCS